MKGFKKIAAHPNYQISKGGKVYNKAKDCIVKTHKRAGGHVGVSLDGTAYDVSRLMAMVYLNNNEPLPRGMEVHHRNHVTNDNRISNLMLLTKDEHKAIHRIEREFMAWAVTTKRYQEFEETRLADYRAGL